MESIFKIVVYLVILSIVSKDSFSTEENKRILSRKKRYLVFPEGASLTVAFCFTINLLEMRTNIFTEVLNLGINYDLPNRTGFESLPVYPYKHSVQRRSRSEVYSKVELVLNALGHDGKSCIYRALCEAAQMFTKNNPPRNLLEEILRIFFRFALNDLEKSEPETHRLYHRAHRLGHAMWNCQDLFPRCPFSIINFLLGYKKNKYKWKTTKFF